MTKSEKLPSPGVALSFGEVMKKINYRIDLQGNVSFWARLSNYNCIQSSIKLTRLSMTTFVSNAGYSKILGHAWEVWWVTGVHDMYCMLVFMICYSLCVYVLRRWCYLSAVQQAEKKNNIPGTCITTYYKNGKNILAFIPSRYIESTQLNPPLTIV